MTVYVLKTPFKMLDIFHEHSDAVEAANHHIIDEYPPNAWVENINSNGKTIIRVSYEKLGAYGVPFHYTIELTITPWEVK